MVSAVWVEGASVYSIKSNKTHKSCGSVKQTRFQNLRALAKSWCGCSERDRQLLRFLFKAWRNSGLRERAQRPASGEFRQGKENCGGSRCLQPRLPGMRKVRRQPAHCPSWDVLAGPAPRDQSVTAASEVRVRK